MSASLAQPYDTVLLRRLYRGPRPLRRQSIVYSAVKGRTHGRSACTRVALSCWVICAVLKYIMDILLHQCGVHCLEYLTQGLMSHFLIERR